MFVPLHLTLAQKSHPLFSSAPVNARHNCRRRERLPRKGEQMHSGPGLRDCEPFSPAVSAVLMSLQAVLPCRLFRRQQPGHCSLYPCLGRSPGFSRGCKALATHCQLCRAHTARLVLLAVSPLRAGPGAPGCRLVVNSRAQDTILYQSSLFPLQPCFSRGPRTGVNACSCSGATSETLSI